MYFLRDTAPVIVVVPPIATLPLTDTSPSNSALPVILDVPPNDVLHATSNVTYCSITTYSNCS